MPLHSRFLFSVVLTLGCLSASQAPGPTPIALNLGQELSFKFLTPLSGWLLVRDGANGPNTLLWTDDTGAHWQPITPLLAPGQLLQSVFFLYQSRGWAVLATFNADSAGHAAVVIASTTDQGKTWSEKPLVVASEDLLADYGGGRIVFTDPAHGWAAIQRMSSSATAIGDLFATSDGGQTWTALPQPPIYGRIGFTSLTHGWLVGGPRRNQLYITQDGGQHWVPAKALARPNVASTSQEVRYGNPAFSDDQHGILAITYVLKRTSVFAVYDTADGGITWKASAFSPSMPSTLASSGFDSTVVNAFRGGQGLVTNIKRPSESRFEQNVAAIPADLPVKGGIATDGSRTSAGNVVDVSFVDYQHGSYLYSWNHCSGFKTGCSTMFKLLFTQDGGKTLTDITPSVPNSSVASSTSTPRQIPEQRLAGQQSHAGTVSPFILSGSGTTKIYNQPGFDTCNYMDIDDMQVWWTNSPYYAVGFYLAGGVTSDRVGCFTPDSDWLFQTACQGWDYMPIWDDLQAPCCTTCSQHMSSDPTTAANQGADSANRAANALANLGLYGAIAYLDIEAYTPDNGGTCSQAVQAFVANWVLYMHSHEYQAGVYGNPTDAAADFFNGPTVQNPPDDMWIALWNHNSTQTCGMNPPLDDNLWSSDQRIHQYDHGITLTYQSATMTIDPDYIDATVTVANVNSGDCPCDVCDPSCANYDPALCQGTCDDDCDPSCPNYDPCDSSCYNYDPDNCCSGDICCECEQEPDCYDDDLCIENECSCTY